MDYRCKIHKTDEKKKKRNMLGGGGGGKDSLCYFFLFVLFFLSSSVTLQHCWGRIFLQSGRMTDYMTDTCCSHMEWGSKKVRSLKPSFLNSDGIQSFLAIFSR